MDFQVSLAYTSKLSKKQTKTVTSGLGMYLSGRAFVLHL